jgi:hypothetical protein
MATQDSPNLYERLGGVYSIATVVDDLIDRVMADPRLPAVGVPTGAAHGAIGECHQHAALHHAAAVVVLGLGQEGVTVAVATRALPDRADQFVKAHFGRPLPTGSGRIKERNRFGIGHSRSRINPSRVSVWHKATSAHVRLRVACPRFGWTRS